MWEREREREREEKESECVCVGVTECGMYSVYLIFDYRVLKMKMLIFRG